MTPLELYRLVLDAKRNNDRFSVFLYCVEKVVGAKVNIESWKASMSYACDPFDKPHWFSEMLDRFHTNKGYVKVYKELLKRCP